MSSTDLLLEKFLTGFKSPIQIGADVEVFVNPSGGEYREALRAAKPEAIRFILDGVNKNAYVWNANLMLHKPAWEKIKAEIGDTRMMYKTGTLASGEWVGNKQSYDMYSLEVTDEKQYPLMYTFDWSWAEKYGLKKVDFIIKRELQNMIFSEDKEKLRAQGYEI